MQNTQITSNFCLTQVLKIIILSPNIPLTTAHEDVSKNNGRGDDLKGCCLAVRHVGQKRDRNHLHLLIRVVSPNAAEVIEQR